MEPWIGWVHTQSNELCQLSLQDVTLHGKIMTENPSGYMLHLLPCRKRERLHSFQ